MNLWRKKLPSTKQVKQLLQLLIPIQLNQQKDVSSFSSNISAGKVKKLKKLFSAYDIQMIELNKTLKFYYSNQPQGTLIQMLDKNKSDQDEKNDQNKKLEMSHQDQKDQKKPQGTLIQMLDKNKSDQDEKNDQNKKLEMSHQNQKNKEKETSKKSEQDQKNKQNSNLQRIILLLLEKQKEKSKMAQEEKKNKQKEQQQEEKQQSLFKKISNFFVIYGQGLLGIFVSIAIIAGGLGSIHLYFKELYQEFYHPLKIIQSHINPKFQGDFIKDSICQKLKNILEKIEQLNNRQQIKIIYGEPGVGKTSSLKYYASQGKGKKGQKKPIIYFSLRSNDDDQKEKLDVLEFLKSKGDDPIKHLNDMRSYDWKRDGFNMLGVWHIDGLYSLLKKYGLDKVNNRVLLIIDEFNAVKAHLDQSKLILHNFMISIIYPMNASWFDVVLVCSEKEFVNRLTSEISTLRNDKFKRYQIKIKQDDFEMYLQSKDFTFEKINLLLQYYSNKRDMRNVIHEHSKDQPLKSLQNKINQDINQRKRDLLTSISSAANELKKEVKFNLKNQKSQNNLVKEFLYDICIKKTIQDSSDNMSIKSALINERVLTDDGETFKSLTYERIYCQGLKYKWNQKWKKSQRYIHKSLEKPLEPLEKPQEKPLEQKKSPS